MKQPQLDNLVRIGQLKTEPAAAEEVQGLVRSGTRRLIDAAQWISPMRVSGSLRAPPMPTLPTSAMPPANMPSSPAPGPTQRSWAGTGSFMVNVRGRHRLSCVGAGPIADRPTDLRRRWISNAAVAVCGCDCCDSRECGDQAVGRRHSVGPAPKAHGPSHAHHRCRFPHRGARSRAICASSPGRRLHRQILTDSRS